MKFHIVILLTIVIIDNFRVTNSNIPPLNITNKTSRAPEYPDNLKSCLGNETCAENSSDDMKDQVEKKPFDQTWKMKDMIRNFFNTGDSPRISEVDKIPLQYRRGK